MYTITPLNLGRFVAFPINKLIFGDKSGETRQSPITAYLIQGQGRKILVDTGSCDAEWAQKNHNFALEIRTGETILEALAANDATPEQIDAIIITHLHWDHCWNLEKFPNAKIYVQKKEMLCALDAEPIFYTAYEHPRRGFENFPWVDSLARFHYVDGDTWLFPGIKVLSLPGHSYGSQGVLVKGYQQYYMLPGDLISARENWEGIPGHKHVPCGTVQNITEYYESFKKLDQYDAEYGFTVIPSHDETALEKAVYQ